MLSTRVAAAPHPPSFDLREIPVTRAIQLVHGEALKRPYVLAPEVLRDQRNVSFRFDGAKGSMDAFWRAMLDSLGYEIHIDAGVDFVRSKATVDVVEPPARPLELMIYRPKFRRVGYLAELLRPLLPDDQGLSVNREIPVAAEIRSDEPAPRESATAQLDRESDVLLYRGAAETISRIRSALEELDQPEAEVLVRGVVYEVATSSKEGTALSLIASLLGGRLKLSVDNRADGASLGLQIGGIDAVLSALSGDSRFRVISTPQLRVKSGASARLTVGQEVPVLSAVSFPQGGSTPVRSVEYRSSGTIFEISPLVREQVIEVSVKQQLSDFARTETGVNDSPTLTKREASTTTAVVSGETVVIGGLTKHHAENSRQGVRLMPFLTSRRGASQQTELVLLLEISELSPRAARAPILQTEDD